MNIPLSLVRSRENYGRSSSDYGKMMAAATWRRGLNDRFTLEAHAQVLSKQRLIGMGMHSLLPLNGVLSLAAATSYANGQQENFIIWHFNTKGVFQFWSGYPVSQLLILYEWVWWRINLYLIIKAEFTQALVG